MMLALLLAQLVLPWPGLDSPLVQPPGMICLGACAGPVIYGPAEQRGRLVVACDMTSDTCSDGRRITTTRATPVPCEVAPGQWEMVPEDTGCYGVRGLESWAATTSYLAYGAELDRSPWGSIRGGTLQPVADGWQVSNDPSQSNSGWVYTGGAADEGVTYTVACRVRAETPTTLRVSPLDAGGSDCPLHQVGAEWATVSCTQTAGAGRSERAHIWPGVGQSGPASVTVAACWLTKTDTPGRPCWGGEAPVTCAGDQHTISTEGWPTESGEICLTATVSRTDTAVILDGRPGWISQGPLLAMQPSGTIRWESDGVRINSHVVAREVPHRICAGRRDGKLTLSVDGVSVPPIDGPPLAWEPVAVLGDSNGGTSQHIDSSISSLHVRSAE